MTDGKVANDAPVQVRMPKPLRDAATAAAMERERTLGGLIRWLLRAYADGRYEYGVSWRTPEGKWRVGVTPDLPTAQDHAAILEAAGEARGVQVVRRPTLDTWEPAP